MDLIALTQRESVDQRTILQFIIHPLKGDPRYLLIQSEQGEKTFKAPVDPDLFMFQHHDQLPPAGQCPMAPVPLQISQCLNIG